MTTSHVHVAHSSAQAAPELIGRVMLVTGSQATVELNARVTGEALRSSLLKKPLEAGPLSAPPGAVPGHPPRFR